MMVADDARSKRAAAYIMTEADDARHHFCIEAGHAFKC